MSDQFLRKVGLIVSAGTKGLDLSALRIHFKVQAPDADAPPTAYIRVYNLNDTDAKAIQNEFQQVTLQAGYQNGNYGIIFKGQIAMVQRGRESATDTFVDIMGADSDEIFNFALCNQTVAAGSKPQQRYNTVMKAMEPFAVTSAQASAGNLSATGGVLPRGKVLWGLARNQMNDLCKSQQCTWSIQNGQVVVIPLTGYLPGQIIEINSRTGLVGVPVATQNGINLTCLLNPYLKVGNRVKINQAELNTTTVRQQGVYPRYGDVNFPASTSADGTYRVLVLEHQGDSRGQEWYSQVTCLAIDSSAGGVSGVQAYG